MSAQPQWQVRALCGALLLTPLALLLTQREFDRQVLGLAVRLRLGLLRHLTLGLQVELVPLPLLLLHGEGGEISGCGGG